MKHKSFTLLVLALSLLFIFSGCRAANEAGEAPAEVAVPAAPTTEIANPAAVYCEEQGFTYEIRTNDDGSQFGVCLLADGTECDEWAFFDGDCPAATAATPTEVVQAFYNWYLDIMSDRSSSDFVNPLLASLYRDSEYLSADFIAQIDAEVANRDQLGGGDPILLAQDVPVRVETQAASVNGNEATVVLLRYWGGNPEPSPMVVHLRQENGRWLIHNITPFEIPETSSVTPQPTIPTADMDPVAVTQAFYDWYLAYIGDRSSGDFRNPLVDKAYHGNPLLTPDFITRVDETLAGFEGGGYDPFLLAQDIPSDMFATWPMLTGDVARVTVLRNWGPPVMDAIFAHLRRDGDIWLIDDITPVELYEPTTDTPEGTVQLFYAWYTDALRRRFEDDAVDADFHNSDLLTDSFKQHLDEMQAAAEAEFPELGLGYDPLLCAQDVPYHVTPDQALIAGETSALTARTSFMNHIITVDLLATADGWRISNVTCAQTPEGAAKAFYTWYLGYIGDRGDGNFRNPLADKAYRGHVLLSDSLVQQVDTMFDGDGRIGHDPFLLAQDVPTNFSVGPGTVENTAVVHLQFGPDLVRHLLLTFTDTYPPRIDHIEEATFPADEVPVVVDISSWQLFTEESYGFAFRYPSDWVREEFALDGPGMPDDWPVTRAFSLMPPAVAEQLAAQSGPPDPNAPVIVAPLAVQVVVGEEDAFNRVYVAPLSSEAAIFNGYSATIQWQEPGYAQYVFRHPTNSLVWVVITDWVTGFPGREEQAKALTDVLLPLLNSLTFNATN